MISECWVSKVPLGDSDESALPNATPRCFSHTEQLPHDNTRRRSNAIISLKMADSSVTAPTLSWRVERLAINATSVLMQQSVRRGNCLASGALVWRMG